MKFLTFGQNVISMLHLPTKPPFLRCSTCFFTRPRRFSYFDVSIDAARLRTDFPISIGRKNVTEIKTNYENRIYVQNNLS